MYIQKHKKPIRLAFRLSKKKKKKKSIGSVYPDHHAHLVMFLVLNLSVHFSWMNSSDGRTMPLSDWESCKQK